MRRSLASLLRIGTAIAMVAAGLVAVNPAPAAAAPSWSIVPSPSPAGPTVGELDGVACTTATNCLAVGTTAAHGTFGELTLGERWNGSSWAQVPTPDPDWSFGAGPAYLSGVACAGKSCFAVGFEVNGSGPRPIIQRWNGSSWSYDAAPGAGSNASLNAVSCTGTSACHAVGGDGTALIATRWNGSAWVSVTIRKPAGATSAALSGVKCTSSTNCVAVGSYTTGSVTKTLIERWNGTAWTVVPSSNPVGATSSSFGGVVCPTASTCFAVGSYTVARAPHQRTLVERWNGASWSIAASPNPAGLPALRSVSCSSVSSCMAVGTKGPSTLIERWNGTAWSIVPSPTPAGALVSSELRAVSCLAAGACYAVGRGAYSSGQTNDRVFAERWNGSLWKMQASPVNASVSPLHGVACAGSTLCFATGSYQPVGRPTTRAFLEQRTGTAWSLLVPPVPEGAVASAFDDVACASTSFCVAVGDATVGSQRTLIERWNGSSWTVEPVAVAGSLASVACSDASNCTAVGTSGGKTLVEQWHGARWTTASGAVPGSLNGVSCSDANDCMAVGAIDLPNSPVLQWDGATWTPIDGAGPTGSGDHDITPTSVSCTAPHDCMLVGNYRNFFDYPLPYAAHWDGATWSRVDMPSEAFGSGTNDIACTSSTDCTAVGSHFPGHGGTVTSVEHWDGTTWAIVTSPNPPAASPPGSGLTSVTCTGAGKCFAVGQWIDDANTRTLIERLA